MKKQPTKLPISKATILRKLTKLRSAFTSTCRYAAILADRCDFPITERIKHAHANINCEDIICCVEFTDQVQKAQIIAALTYGATLNNLSIVYTSMEDTKLTNRNCAFMTIIFK